MTTAEKIKLVNDLIAENPDTTIADYLEVLRMIEKVETTLQLFPLKKTA